MVLSGYEILPDSRAAEASAANRATPLLACHGTFDEVVPLYAGRAAYDAHTHGGRPAAWHAFPMAHQVCLEEIEVIRVWLASRLG
jgi:phospholipase/carboxylesterase